MPAKRLLIIDDSVTIRALLEQVLGSEKDIHIIGSVDSGEYAIAAIELLRPDVITLDLLLPGIDGFAVLDFVMSNYPSAVIIVSASGTSGSDVCRRALNCGASSCFDKARIVSDAGKLRRAVLTAKRGRLLNGGTLSVI